MRALGLERLPTFPTSISTRTLVVATLLVAILLVGSVLAYGGVPSWLGGTAGIDPAAFDCY